MPGGDGTGPQGIGPMTGRGRGYCIVPIDNGREISNGNPTLKGIPVGLNSLYQYNHNKSYNLIRRYTSHPGRSMGYFGRAAIHIGKKIPRTFFRGRNLRRFC